MQGYVFDLIKVNIFIPFTKLEARTLLAFKGKRCQVVPIVGEFGYAEYFKERWQEGRSFINVEHDIVPDWELVTELMACPQSICLTKCLLDQSWLHHWHLGCVKISDRFIAEHPIDWGKQRYTDCDGTIWTAYGGDEKPVCIHGQVTHLRYT